jgi:hypothetical protein
MAQKQPLWALIPPLLSLLTAPSHSARGFQLAMVWDANTTSSNLCNHPVRTRVASSFGPDRPSRFLVPPTSQKSQ